MDAWSGVIAPALQQMSCLPLTCHNHAADKTQQSMKTVLFLSSLVLTTLTVYTHGRNEVLHIFVVSEAWLLDNDPHDGCFMTQQEADSALCCVREEGVVSR